MSVMNYTLLYMYSLTQQSVYPLTQTPSPYYPHCSIFTYREHHIFSRRKNKIIINKKQQKQAPLQQWELNYMQFKK